MILNDNRWATAEDVYELAAEISNKCTNDKGGFLAQLKRWTDSPEPDGTQHMLIAGRTRPLDFYHGYRLAELEVSTNWRDLHKEFQRAFVYALLSDSDGRLLTGESPVIHEMNKLERGSNGSSTRVLRLDTEQQISNYLRFFCTFVAGSDGPFMLPEDGSDLAYAAAPVDNRQADVVRSNFEVVVARTRERFGWPKPHLDLDKEDIARLIASDLEPELIFRDQLRDYATLFGDGGQERLVEKIAPVKYNGPIEKDGEVISYRVDASVWYADALFDANFAVLRSGMIQMENDKPKGFFGDPGWRYLDNLPVLARRHFRRKVTAEVFRAVLLAESGISVQSVEQETPLQRLNNLRIDGDLDLANLQMGVPLLLDNLEIDGDLILDKSRFESTVTLKQVKIRGCIRADQMQCRAFEASDLRVDGLFDRTGMVQGQGVAATPGISLRAIIDDDLILERAEIKGGLKLDGLRCGGSANLNGLVAEARLPTYYTIASDELRGCQMANARIAGNVNFRPATTSSSGLGQEPACAVLQGDLVMNGSVIEGSVVLDGLRMKSMHGARIFEKDEKLQDLKEKLEEMVDSKDCGVTFDQAFSCLLFFSPVPREGDIRLERTQIGGALEMNVVHGRSTVHQVDISGHLICSEASVGRRVQLSEAKVGGMMSFQSSAIGSDLFFAGARIQGDALFARTSIGGSLAFAGAFIGGEMRLDGARIESMVDGDSTRASRTKIGGDVIMSGAICKSDVRFCGSRIAGKLQCITGTFGRIQIRRELVDEPLSMEAPAETDADANVSKTDEPKTKPVAKAPRLHGILIQSAKIMSLDLFGAKIGNEEKHDGLFGVELDGVEIEEDFSFFKDDPHRYLTFKLTSEELETVSLPPLSGIRAEIHGNLNLRRVTVGGDLILTNVACAGDAKLEQIKVGGDLGARSTVTAIDSEGGEALSADFQTMRMDGAEIEHDLELDGLSLGGGLTIAASKIRGDTTLSRQIDAGTHHHLSVPRNAEIDLTGLQTRKLMISGDIGRDTAYELSRAELDFLEIHGNLPYQIDLGGATVSNWELLGSQEKGLRLRQLLARSAPPNPAIYAGAETWLRRRGEDKTADQVHEDLRWRETLPAIQRDARAASPFRPSRLGIFGAVIAAGGPFSRRGRDMLIGILTGFWTHGARVLVYLGFPTLVVSIMMVTTSVNMRPTHQDGQIAWTLSDQLRTLLDIHVPIVPSTTLDWQPAKGQPLRLRAPFVHEHLPEELAGSAVGSTSNNSGPRAWHIHWISPANYALIVRLIHWIAWPLALIGVAANIDRRRDRN